MSKINIIGAAGVDILLKGFEKEKFFSGHYKVSAINSAFGGDALNETLVLSHLQQDVRLISVLGNDLYGKLIRDKLQEEGIAFDDNNFRDDIETYVSLVFIDEDGGRSFVGNEEGSSRVLSLADIKVDEDARIVNLASLFISKKLGLAEYEELFCSLKRRDLIICADSSAPKNDEDIRDCHFLKYVDHLFINENEARLLCHTADLSKCERLIYQQGCGHVYIKAGNRGCLYHNQYYLPSKQITCIDSTGAGDSFAAGFISKLVTGADIEECIRFGNECGGKACQHIGATAWLNALE